MPVARSLTPGLDVVSADVSRIEMLTQDEFDAIATPDPTTWYVITDAATDGAPVFSGARVTQGAAVESVASGASEPIPFATEAFDTDGYHDGTNPERLSIPPGFGGYFMVGGYAEVDNQADQKVIVVAIRQDGATTIASLNRSMASGASADHGGGNALPTFLAEGSWIELVVTNTDTVARDVRSGYLWLYRLGS